MSACRWIRGHHGTDHTVDGRRPGAPAHASRAIHLSARQIVDTMAPYDLSPRCGASSLGHRARCRRGWARREGFLPGGCAIGTRPARSSRSWSRTAWRACRDRGPGVCPCQGGQGLTGAEINFPKVTVGGTHTALMAASLAIGHTVLLNVAREPEITDLADRLIKMGARASRAPGNRLSRSRVLAASRGRATSYCLTVLKLAPMRWRSPWPVAMSCWKAPAQPFAERDRSHRKSGAEISATNEGLRVRRNGAGLSPVDIPPRHSLVFPPIASPVHGLDDKGQRALRGGPRRFSRTASRMFRNWSGSAPI